MSSVPLDIISIAGARPNFMKIAPLARAFAAYTGIRHRIVHTGQHYDRNMSDTFFQELEIPEPWRNLEVGSGSHAVQTAETMIRFERVLLEDPPSLLLVVGDVNSTIACSLVAVKRGIPVAHVEAGLRSFDRSMPEEINRVLTDAISDVLLVSEPSGLENLSREGVPKERVFLTGNVMIDTLLRFRERARSTTPRVAAGLAPKSYGVVTLHRPANVDDPKILLSLLQVLKEIAARQPLIFPVHPRTLQRLKDLGETDLAQAGIKTTEPLGYLEFLGLMENANLLLTDSGGIQEEACILGVPCLTLRENTERPVTVAVGWNRLVGRDVEAIRREAFAILNGTRRPAGVPDLWDGKASERIAAILWKRYGPGSESSTRATSATGENR